jgi:hypothetical protein
MSIRWLALYTAEDTHPRLFDSLDGALNYLERFEQLSEEMLDYFALRIMSEGVAKAVPPEVRYPYHLTYCDLRSNQPTTHPEKVTLGEAR